ncbi:hypothetical protein LX36DRAFT_179415 [Colletotrichum falcatum]|nr:hypothetical protein LX36DRAFT_179415 [Colletotrichum falcatum]
MLPLLACSPGLILAHQAVDHKYQGARLVTAQSSGGKTYKASIKALLRPERSPGLNSRILKQALSLLCSKHDVQPSLVLWRPDGRNRSVLAPSHRQSEALAEPRAIPRQCDQHSPAAGCGPRRGLEKAGTRLPYRVGLGRTRVGYCGPGCSVTGPSLRRSTRRSHPVSNTWILTCGSSMRKSADASSL